MPREPEYADPQRYIDLVGFTGTWRDLFWNKDFLDLIARRLRFQDVSKALDVGCGAGHWTRTVLSHLPDSARITGVDREEAFLELARKGSDPARSHFEIGTAEELPFPDASFDLVTCQLVLIHVADPLRALTEMKRVLKPGGLLVTAEPDNRAGNLALLNGDPRPSDEDYLLITSLLIRGERGKLALGEGDQSVGGRLVGIYQRAGLDEVVAYNNDRCIALYPPYERADMKVSLDQEFAFGDEGVSVLVGTRNDNLRFFEAGGGTPAEFDTCWAAIERWMTAVREGVKTKSYAAGRGFVMYVTAGRKPAA